MKMAVLGRRLSRRAKVQNKANVAQMRSDAGRVFSEEANAPGRTAHAASWLHTPAHCDMKSD
jgi:hypothetical protein